MAERFIPGKTVTDFNFQDNFDTSTFSESDTFLNRESFDEQTTNQLFVKSVYQLPERRSPISWEVYTTVFFSGITGTTGYSGQTGFTGTTGVTTGITTGITTGTTTGTTSGTTTGTTSGITSGRTFTDSIYVFETVTLKNSYYKDFYYTYQGVINFNYKKNSWPKIQSEIVDTGANLTKIQEESGMDRSVLRRAIFSGALKLKRFYNNR